MLALMMLHLQENQTKSSKVRAITLVLLPENAYEVGVM